MKALSILIAVLLSALPALAQKQSSQPNEQEILLQKQQLRAISMIEQTAGEAMAWNDKKTAAGVLADASDLLWPEMPKSAAKWLTRSWALTTEIPASAQNERLKELFTRSEKTELQARVLRIANKYDPKLAERFIKEIGDREPEERKNRGAFDNRSARSEQLLWLADQAVDSDPDLAFNLAASSLTDGVSQTLQSVLTGLRVKRVDLANRLFDLALARFSSRPPDPSEAEILAGYLFSSGITFSVNSEGRTIFAAISSYQRLPPAAVSDPQRARSFLVAAYQAFFGRPIAIQTSDVMLRARRILAFGRRAGPRYAALAPEFAGPLQQSLAELQRQLDPNATTAARESAKKDDSTKRRTRDEMYEDDLAELIDEADKETDPNLKKTKYAKAALATKPEHYQRAKDIISNIADDNLRADLASFVLYRAALFYVEAKEIDKAIDIAPRIENFARRAVVKIAIGRAFVSTKTTDQAASDQPSVERQRAFDLLSSVDEDVRKEGPSAKAVKILLGKTAVMATLDNSLVLSSLAQAVGMINRLDWFDLRDGDAPDLELKIPGLNLRPVAVPRGGFDFHSAIDPLVVTDFEAVSDAVELLAQKEVRGVGRFEVAKWYLQKNPVKKPAKPRASL